MSEIARRICVIGCGAAGIITAKALRQRGLRVVVYESTSHVGGTWILSDNGKITTKNSKADLENYDHSEFVSSIYDGLWTNLPKDIMRYSNVAIDSEHRFPHHVDIGNYLKKCVDVFHLRDLISFNSKVQKVDYDNNNWKVTIDKAGEKINETFDGVVVCNGHYSTPFIPKLKGLSNFKGDVIHSHWYREPTPWTNKKVLVVGSGASGCDITREIAGVTPQVFISVGRSLHAESIRELENVIIKSRMSHINEKGQVVFDNGDLLDVDCILYATGYNYTFSFFDHTEQYGNVSQDGFKVDHLYKHMIDINYPSLCYVGIPFKVIPFPLFEFQANYLAEMFAVSSEITTFLPAYDEMKREVDTHEEDLLKKKIDLKYFHLLGDKQFSYCDSLVEYSNQKAGEKIYKPCDPEVEKTYQQARELRKEHLGY